MVYQYLAYNEGGELVKGKLTAQDEDTATELLNYAGYKAVSLKPHHAFLSLDKIKDALSRVTQSEVVILYQQLAMLLEAGSNIATSLEILQQQLDNRALKKVLGEIISEVRGGGRLSFAMTKHPQVFSPMHCRLINIGEQSGNLETMLNQIADDMDKELTTIKETKSALMYPVITLLVTIGVIAVLMTFVMPSLSALYLSLDVELPLVTRIMLSLSAWVNNKAPFIALTMFVVSVFTYFYIRTRRGRYLWDKFLLKMPYLGRVRHLIELARCSRSLSLLFNAGLPLTEAIPLVSQSCSNTVIAVSFNEVHKKMVKGEGLASPMSANKLFLPLMVQMVRVGEETGSLDSTLLTVSKSYSREADYKLKSVITLIQPAMTIIIGVLVGFITLSMTSALYGIYQGF